MTRKKCIYVFPTDAILKVNKPFQPWQNLEIQRLNCNHNDSVCYCLIPSLPIPSSHSLDTRAFGRAWNMVLFLQRFLEVSLLYLQLILEA